MIPCRIAIQGLRGQYLQRDVWLPCLPPIGGYVCVEPDSLGLKVAIILVSPQGATLKVKEETEGDFDFAGLEAEGWQRS